MAIDLDEADLAQPRQLGVDCDELVGWVVLGRRLADGGEEVDVQLRRRRVDVLEVQEAATGLEGAEGLAVERALALVDAVVDREARDDEVEASEVG